jgi:hypothetical protein
LFKNNSLSIDMSWIDKLSNTSIRSVFKNLYVKDIKNASSSQLCIETYKTLLNLVQRYSLEGFVRYINENHRVKTQ